MVGQHTYAVDKSLQLGESFREDCALALLVDLRDGRGRSPVLLSIHYGHLLLDVRDLLARGAFGFSERAARRCPVPRRKEQAL